MGPRWRIPAALLAIAAIAACAGLGADRARQQQDSDRFHALAQGLTARVCERMRSYEHGLRGLRGAVLASGGERMTRGQMRLYAGSHDIDHEFPGARGFGLVLRTAPRDEDEEDIVKFVEPSAPNAPDLGLDIASEPRRREAARAAMLEGAARLTAPVSLTQASGGTLPGFLLLLPIYRPGMPTATAAEREAATLGWSYAPLSAAGVLDGLDLAGGELSITLADLGAGAGLPFSGSGVADPGNALVLRENLDVHGRTWVAEVRPTRSFGALDAAGGARPGGVAAAAAAALLAGAAALLLRSHGRQRRERDEMARRAAIVESCGDAIVAETLDGIVTAWNPAAERLFGHAAGQALGQAAADLLLPRPRAAEDARLRQAIARGERPPAFDTTRLHRDGTLIEVSIAVAPVLDDAGRCVGLAKTLRDIREDRAARRALQERNDCLERSLGERTERLETALRDLHAILDNVPSMIGYWDRSLANRVANRAYASWLGTEPDALRGRHLAEVADPGELETLRPHIEAALAGCAQAFERTLDDGSGTRHHLVHYLPDTQDGEVRGFYVLTHDVTEITDKQRALADALRENAAILQTVHGHALVSVADRTGRIIDVNESFCRVSGYSAEELLGQNHRIVNSGEHDRDFWRQMWRTIGHGAVWHGEVCNRAKDGSLYWVDSVVAPFLDAEGRIEKYVAIRTDITPIKRLQREAEDARRRATLASNAKSQFLANMSHEIRTPMNAVIGLTYLLRKTTLSDEQAGFVDKIGMAGRALLALINDILDLSKIEACEMHLEAVPFSLRDVISEVSAIMGAQAEGKGIRLEVDLPPEVPDGLVGDPTRVRQVLLNLLGNSIKFTQRGLVRLAVAPAPGEAAGGARAALSFCVTDTGIGIAPDQLKRLFQPFVQADTSTTRRFGGTGLGLSIVRQLLELMGGRIDVRSEPGAGSEFTARIAFPLADADAVLHSRGRPGPADAGAALDGLSVLVVDDSEINLEVARRILEGKRARVTLAHDGREAVELLRARPDRADLVLMDVQMPVMDGHDATRHIRRELGLTGLPVIALTAGLATGERERALAAGMNDVVGKPFDPDALVACILQATRRARAHRAVPDEAPEAPAQGWPEIPGIDTADARRRMGGDVGLLNTLLGHFLKDTDDLPALLAEPAADKCWAAQRLHNLKGSAATLGARELSRLAARMEDGLLGRGQDGDAGLAPELKKSLCALRQACRAHLERAEITDSDAAHSAADLDPAAVNQLARQLAQADFNAPAAVRRLSAGLRRRLGDSGYHALREACADRRYEEALELLAGVVTG